MSIVTFCDECGRGSRWLQPTPAKARRVVAGDGWKHHAGKDYCEQCKVPA